MYVAQIGPFPPPVGGVSVHVQRLHERLLREGHRSVVYASPNYVPSPRSPPCVIPRPNIRYLDRQTWLLRHGLFSKADIIHCHDGFIWSAAIWPTLILGRSAVMTIHNEIYIASDPRLSYASNWFSRRMLQSKQVSWIAVNGRIADYLQEMGVQTGRLFVIPAYIAPSLNIAGILPPAMELFLSQHGPVLSVYGFRTQLDANGVDLYGFDMALLSLAILKDQYPKVGLVIAVSQTQEPLFTKMLALISALGLNERVHVVTGGLPDGPLLWSRCQVYLRPTTTDGDSLSVREALSLGTPVVASDAVGRPPGVRLFKNRDVNALVQSVVCALEQLRTSISSPAGVDMCSYAEVRRVYESLLTTTRRG